MGKVGILRRKMNTPTAYDASQYHFFKNYSSITIKISRFAGNFIFFENIKKPKGGLVYFHVTQN
jgi:hypothetical protein